jgi:glutathione-regulated potassium-efflux system ancillary protein KefG
MEAKMTQTLILLFHPDLSRSRANAALARAAQAVPGTDVIDMQARFPAGLDMARDGKAEAARLIAAERLVLQFPLHWYAPPPLVQSWQATVLTRMMYLLPDSEGACLAGKPFRLAITTGGAADAYRNGGRNLFPIPEMLAPLRATANRCGLAWSNPFVLHDADSLSEEQLEAAARTYAADLVAWQAASLPVLAEA